MDDRNKAVIRLLMTEQQYISPHINLFRIAMNPEVIENTLTGFLLVIPRGGHFFAPHRVKFSFTGTGLHNAKNPHSLQYRVYQQTVRLTEDEKQLRLEADMVKFFNDKSFHLPLQSDTQRVQHW